MKRILSLLYLSLSMPVVWGQLAWMNPSFEGGHYDCTNTNIKEWTTCEIGIANCKIDTIPEAQPDSAVDGRYVAEVSADLGYIGSFSQQTACALQQGVAYEFSAWFASYIPTNNATLQPFKFSEGQIEVWCNKDSCQRDQLVLLTDTLRPVWEKHTIRFIPNETSYHIMFRGHPPIGSLTVISTLMIDALSPIAVVNAHQVHTGVSDTVFVKGTTACIKLSAFTDTAMGSVWWEQVGAGTISNQLHAGVFCTDTNTTYIVHTLTHDSTCAGYLPSSDTVRVRFVEANSITQQEQVSMRLYPNPANEVLYVETNKPGVVQVFNGLGQLLKTTHVNQGFNHLQISDLPVGVYHATFFTENAEVANYRLIIK